MKKVILTSVSGTLARGIIRGLKAAPEPISIVGVDSSKYHLLQAKGEVDDLRLVPRADHPEFIRILAEIAAESGADFLWPLHDAEIKKVTEAASDIPVRTWLPPISVCVTCRDKLATYKVLKQAGVPVPATVSIDTREDLASTFDRFGGEIWLRARTGAGSIGAFRTSSFEHGSVWLDIHEGWGSFTAAEVLPGPYDYSWESIWKGGELVAGQVETRLVRGNTGISPKGVTHRGVLLRDAPSEVESVSEQAVRAVMPSPDGIFRVDLSADASGLPNVTEVDAGRFGAGGVAYWHEYGYNWAYEALRLGFDEPVDYAIPVRNPCPADKASITGFNRELSVIDMADVEEKVGELESRLDD